MAIIPLTEEEYKEVQSLHEDALSKIATASPRLSAHYQKIAKLHADFLAKEDGKRAVQQKRQNTRTQLAQLRLQRRVAALQSSQRRLVESSNASTEKNTTSGQDI